MTAGKKKTYKRLEGQVLRIALNDETHAYARVLEEPLIAFYAGLYRNDQELSVDEIAALPVTFKIWVMNCAVTKGVWPIIGHLPLTSDLKAVPRFFKQDAMNGQLAVYQSIPELAPTYERVATYEECLGLEMAAIWDPSHVEGRLRDHFVDRPNRWVERAKTPDEFKAHEEEMRHKREGSRRKKVKQCAKGP